MDAQNPSVPAHAQTAVPGRITPTGVTHVNVRHTAHYTVIGNHLVQHRELSLTAIGLAAHIQSLPAGSRVDIKTLAARFPEGEVRIAAALRELEEHGYLARTRERLPNGRIVTHTVSYNQPSGTTPIPDGPSPALPDEDGEGGSEPPLATQQQPPVPAEPKPPLANLPQHRTASALLASLRHDDPRLLLSERDVRCLAPAVTTWLDRGARPEAVRNALTANLPAEPLRHPAAFLAHRLTTHMPPPTASPGPTAPRRHPLQTCDGCDRAFRAPVPGRCRDCRSDLLEVA
ncbi:helix-turn-helix domain-containing protein [Streptomyces sp. NPDC001795]|uniref:helix-turn-helix domain-containing protein n=1 Tax=Streptomyces sp. NPDC001795 TaxID=3154525 RepID=UPI00332E0BD5